MKCPGSSEQDHVEHHVGDFSDPVRAKVEMWFVAVFVLFGVALCQDVKDMNKKMMTVPVNTRDICKRDPSSTSANQTPGDNGFRIKLSGRTQTDNYTPGQVYTGKVTKETLAQNQNAGRRLWLPPQIINATCKNWFW